jgi:hypothetical protein
MTKPVQLAPVIRGAVGPATNPIALTPDAVDTAVSNLTTVADYFRAERFAASAGSLTSRVGALVTVDPAVTFHASDANFGGDNTFDFSSGSANFGFATDELLPSDFTFIAPIRLSALKSVSNILGSTSGAGGFACYANGSGAIAVDDKWASGEGATTISGVTLATNTTYVFWISARTSDKTIRIGTSNSVGGSVVRTAAHAGAAGAFARPFSFQNNSTGNMMAGRSSGYLLLNKAYLNDGGTEDTRIAALMTAWRGLLGV